jgi:RNase adaptor protein for sRNA GlmZ degradation
MQQNKLKVRVNSFSFKKGIPVDESGNGGGFVFDCRGIHNPGLYDEYKPLTGKDQPVIKFLEDEGVITKLLGHAEEIVAISVDTYLKREFTDLMVSFGCTGGRHRSVYCAEKMADYLRSSFDIDVVLTHREQASW